MREQLTKAHATIHCDRSNELTSRASSGIEASTCKLEATRECSSSGSSFFKKKCPFWWRKKRATKSPQEGAASKSRLCVETAHESPIPAVRKPVPREETLGWDRGNESTGAKSGSSLLRKLLCLKAASSRPKKPPHSLEASPLYTASTRCGPIAALRKTDDPQGESPLRWKPRAETESPAAAPSSSAEVMDTTAKPTGSWVTKPWRTFRTVITSQVKKRSVLPGMESNHRATEDGDLYIPTEPETSSNTKTNTAFGKRLSNAAAIEDQKPSEAFPAHVDNAHSIQENKGSQRISWHGLEIHRVAEDDMEAKEEKRISLTLEGSHWVQNPAHTNMSAWESLQKQVYTLPRGNRAEAQDTAMEDEDPAQGRCGYWVPEEEEDLGDLAENPGGQGMLMATRDLGWLTSELLRGPESWKTEQKAETEMPKTQERGEEKAITVDVSEGGEHNGEAAMGLATDMAHIDRFFLPPLASGNNRSHVMMPPHSDTPGADILEGGENLFPPKAEPSAPLELFPSSFSTKGLLEQGFLTPLPSKPCEAVAMAEEKDGRKGQASPTRKSLLPTKELHGATAWQDATWPEPERDKQLIYLAAVEIVGAAIDAAAVQLAKKEEEEEQAESRLSKQVP